MRIQDTSPQLSPVTELARTVVAGWPFGRGTSRIASLMGTLFFHNRQDGVIGRTGYGDTLSPWQSDEFRDPTFWHLYEKPVRREMRRLLAPGDVYVDVGAHRGGLPALGYHWSPQAGRLSHASLSPCTPSACETWRP